MNEALKVSSVVGKIVVFINNYRLFIIPAYRVARSENNR